MSRGIADFNPEPSTRHNANTPEPCSKCLQKDRSVVYLNPTNVQGSEKVAQDLQCFEKMTTERRVVCCAIAKIITKKQVLSYMRQGYATMSMQ